MLQYTVLMQLLTSEISPVFCQSQTAFIARECALIRKLHRVIDIAIDITGHAHMLLLLVIRIPEPQMFGFFRIFPNSKKKLTTDAMMT